MQRLRMRAAGQKLFDFWLDEESLVSLFGSIHVLHAPAAQTARRVSKLAADGSAEPTLLVVQPPEGSLPGSKVCVCMCVCEYVCVYVFIYIPTIYMCACVCLYVSPLTAAPSRRSSSCSCPREACPAPRYVSVYVCVYEYVCVCLHIYWG